MDFDAACDQFTTLLTINPAQVYKSSYYRKQTKNHWARDDPAYAVIQVALIVVSTCAYGAATGVSGFWRYLTLLLHAVGVHWLLLGIAFASLASWLANSRLQARSQGQMRAHSVAQKVEWLYAFDIHCNAAFPVFLLLHPIQFFLLPLLLSKTLLALAASNALYAAAACYYCYITHLGYRALPFLHNTQVYLYPAVAVLMLFALSVVLGLLGYGVNMTRLIMHIYFT